MSESNYGECAEQLQLQEVVEASLGINHLHMPSAKVLCEICFEDLFYPFASIIRSFEAGTLLKKLRARNFIASKFGFHEGASELEKATSTKLLEGDQLFHLVDDHFNNKVQSCEKYCEKGKIKVQ
ncbi:hypothetical protein RND71_002031 [Anisodus tanguticus]|uniref:Uncharacterized protein n=1 Tax=Anisodus tanguticus TaxID=243964 RepID=A0AAE1VYF5_9SOLA|nr:hypothetical protein RND71_002031 [Anisodus tanguticus]